MSSNTTNSDNSGKQGKGFASMDPQKQREASSQGGQASSQGHSKNDMTNPQALNRSAADKSASNTQRTASVGTQGGTPEQHAQAGRQSHKNSKN